MTQYIQNFWDMTHFCWPVWSSTDKEKKLMLNTVETNVAGRKARVTTEMVFIEALSLLAALLISTVALLSR